MESFRIYVFCLSARRHFLSSSILWPWTIITISSPSITRAPPLLPFAHTSKRTATGASLYKSAQVFTRYDETAFLLFSFLVMCSCTRVNVPHNTCAALAMDASWESARWWRRSLTKKETNRRADDKSSIKRSLLLPFPHPLLAAVSNPMSQGICISEDGETEEGGGTRVRFPKTSRVEWDRNE